MKLDRFSELAKRTSNSILSAQTFGDTRSLLSSTKSFEEIPHKRGPLLTLIDLLISGGPSSLHEHCGRRHKELGPIFREHLGPNELVFVADSNLIRTTIANEGPRPHHNVPEAWQYYNQVKKIDRGLFFQAGESWYKLRKAFNKVMLADDNLVRFGDDLLDINQDLFSIWRQRYAGYGDTLVIKDVKHDLCNWSIESTGLMLFGNRLGCVAHRSNPFKVEDYRGRKLVDYVIQMFSETSKFQMLPVRLAHRLNLNQWKRFEEASDRMLQIANEYASEFITQTKQANSRSCLLKDLIELRTLDDDELSRSMVDLIIAAADTTSLSLQWMLYLVAKYPNVQRNLLQEAQQITKKPPKNFNELYTRVPYHMAFMKETVRLYPVAPFLARTLDHEVILNSYKIPAGTPIVFSLFTTSRMETYFDNPLMFQPERWLRNRPERDEVCARSRDNAFASLPFGVGSRKCIGHKVANLEMCLFVASFVNEFESTLLESNDNLKIKLNMTLCPDRPVSLRLEPRKR